MTYTLFLLWIDTNAAASLGFGFAAGAVGFEEEVEEPWEASYLLLLVLDASSSTFWYRSITLTLDIKRPRRMPSNQRSANM